MTMESTILDTDKVVGDSAADHAVDPAPARWTERARWSELAPSDYEVLALMFSRGSPDEVSEEVLTEAAVLAAVQALAHKHAAHVTFEEKPCFFGLFLNRTAWISKGDSRESWPAGSIESSLQGRLSEARVMVRDLVAGWIGEERKKPWRDMRDRILERLVRQGMVERREERESFLFFSWSNSTHRLSQSMEGAMDNYARVARRTGVGLPLPQDRSPVTGGQRGAIAGEVRQGFVDRWDAPDSD